MMNKKDLTERDSIDFWKAFDSRHPQIGSHLKSRVFINGDIVAFKPKTIDDNSYRIFERYLSRWLSDNNFRDKEIDLIYVSLNEDINKGVRAIDTSTIVSIEQVNNELSRLTMKDNDKNIEIFIKENAENLKQSVYIF
jgi:hypothetical protein